MSATNPIGTVQNKFRDDFSATSFGGKRWQLIQTGPGMTVDLSTPSALRILAGATANSETIIRSVESYETPCRVMFLPLGVALINQRVANQEIELRLVNADGTSYAGWLFDGTVTTTGKMRSANEGIAAADLAVASLPDSVTGSLVPEVESWIDECYWHARTADSTSSRTISAVRNRRIPNPDEMLFVEIRVRNLGTAPTAGTILALDAITVQDVTELTAEITAGRGGGADSQAIRMVGNVSVTSGTVTTRAVHSAADPVSSALLGAGASMTQTGLDTGSDVTQRPTRHRPTILHLAGTTHGQARLEESTDGTTWRETWRCPIPSDGQYHTFDVAQHLRYARWLFTNGSVAQTAYYFGNELVRGEGPADIDKVLTFPQTAAAGVALAAAGLFTSQVLDLGPNHQWDTVRLWMASDQITAANGVVIQQSLDGTNFFTAQGSTASLTTAGSALIIEQAVAARYVRAQITMGATAATALRAALTIYTN